MVTRMRVTDETHATLRRRLIPRSRHWGVTGDPPAVGYPATGSAGRPIETDQPLDPNAASKSRHPSGSARPTRRATETRSKKMLNIINRAHSPMWNVDDLLIRGTIGPCRFPAVFLV